ncbi:SAM-dependent methyltransferase [Nocardia sp. NPDC056100]|uniref:class I SAM-dependent methyltransferase n=1 Tax=Nocardia sp. NPDC056100 TaxID=3345712 RepID=UPI0035E03098
MTTNGAQADIANTVGLTALGSAAFRAVESKAPDALITDEFAERFVYASGVEHLIAIIENPTAKAHWPAFSSMAGVRTKSYDDFFLNAIAAGARQAVILASGLDARPYRLDWPADMTVYEIDLTEVFAFKKKVYEDTGAVPKVQWSDVATDLTGDWATDLIAAGFDPTIATAWSAEGLVPYLPTDAQNRLFEKIDELSAAGSHFAVGVTSPTIDMQKFLAASQEHTKDITGESDGPSMAEMIFLENEQIDAVGWLNAHGWNASAIDAADLMNKYGRELAMSEQDVQSFRDLLCVTAIKSPGTPPSMGTLDWEAVYRGDSPINGDQQPPWNIGRPQQAIIDLETGGEITGTVLDSACGVGATALWFARQGYRTVGIDIATSAIATATADAAAQQISDHVRFETADLRTLTCHDGEFDTIIDNASFNSFPREGRSAYLASLARAAAPGARLFILCFSQEEFDREFTGRMFDALTDAEIHDTVAEHWTIDSITESYIEIAQQGIPPHAASMMKSFATGDNGLLRLPARLLAAHLPA